MTRPLISRRSLLATAAAAVACGRPKSTPFAGYCFVANQGGNSVAAVDLEHFRLRRQIALDAAPSSVLAHPTAPIVYALAPDAGTVYQIESARLAVTGRVKAGGAAVSMRLAPGGRSLWVLYRDPAMLAEIDLKSLKTRTQIPLKSPPDSFNLTWQRDDSAEPMAAVSSLQDHSVTLVSLVKREQRRISLDVEPSLVTFRKDNELLMVGSRSDRTLCLYEIVSGKRVVRLPLPLAPRFFQTSEDGWLFLTGDGMDAVVIAFPSTTEIWQTALAGHAPGAMAVAERADTLFLLVANPASATVTVLDVAYGQLVGVVGVGQSPCQILITQGQRPDEQFVLVVNQESGDMAVIRMLALTEPQLAAKPRFKSASLLTMIPLGEKPVSGAIVAM